MNMIAARLYRKTFRYLCWILQHLHMSLRTWISCYYCYLILSPSMNGALDGFLYWMLDLLTTYTHDSELQAVNNTTASLHNSQITTAPAKPFPACSVITSRSLITGSNSGESSASSLMSPLNGGSLRTVPFLHSLPHRTDQALTLSHAYNVSAHTT
jgi:hypothetical protein